MNRLGASGVCRRRSHRIVDSPYSAPRRGEPFCSGRRSDRRVSDLPRGRCRSDSDADDHGTFHDYCSVGGVGHRGVHDGTSHRPVRPHRRDSGGLDGQPGAARDPRTTGFPAEGLFLPPDRIDEYSEDLDRLRRGEHVKRFETTSIHKDGHPIDVSITMSPVKDRVGVVVGASVVARDISEQKVAHEALRLSEERFRVALKNAPVVVFSHDLQLRYTWINAPVLAVDYEDYLGRTDAELFAGEDGARLTAIKEEVLRTGIETQTEVTVTLKGERHYFNLLVEPLHDPTGGTRGLLCSAIDITSLKETIAKLQQALDEVQLLSGLLSICASCKKIKDERGVWQPMEVYIQGHSEAKFSHGVCPDCFRRLYPECCP